jgi:hypothetical protein
VPSIEEGLIDLPLAKQPGTGGEKMMVDKSEQGQPARSRYRVLDRAGNRACWVELQPLTGRTHQLRVHMAAIGHPIIGDGKYGGPEAFLSGSISRKMHLHARRLIIEHPDGTLLDVEAPCPITLPPAWRNWASTRRRANISPIPRATPRARARRPPPRPTPSNIARNAAANGGAAPKRAAPAQMARVRPPTRASLPRQEICRQTGTKPGGVKKGPGSKPAAPATTGRSTTGRPTRALPPPAPLAPAPPPPQAAMSTPPRLAVFDCDGTLVDGQHELSRRWTRPLPRWGWLARAHAITRIVGLSLPQAMRRLLPEGEPQVQAALVEAYKQAFRTARAEGRLGEPLYDGIRELLDDLRAAGWDLAVATGKSDRGLAHCLATHGLTDHFASCKPPTATLPSRTPPCCWPRWTIRWRRANRP